MQHSVVGLQSCVSSWSKARRFIIQTYTYSVNEFSQSLPQAAFPVGIEQLQLLPYEITVDPASSGDHDLSSFCPASLEKAAAPTVNLWVTPPSVWLITSYLTCVTNSLH